MKKIIVSILVLCIAVQMITVISMADGIEPIVEYNMNNADNSSGKTHVINSIDPEKYELVGAYLQPIGTINSFSYGEQKYIESEVANCMNIAIENADFGEELNGGFTYESWINMKNVGTHSPHIFSIANDGKEIVWLRIVNRGQRIVFFNQFEESSYQWWSNADFDFQNSWNHLVVTYDNSDINNIPSVYINGKKMTMTKYTGTIGTKNIPFTSEPLIRLNNSSLFSFARMASVKLYGEVLTEEEIINKYDESKAYFEPIKDIRLYKEDTFVEKSELLNQTEGNFNATLDIEDLNSDALSDKFYIINKETNQKAEASEIIEDNLYKIDAGNLYEGEYSLVLSKDILLSDGTSLRKSDYILDFKVSKNDELRAEIVEELKGLTEKSQVEEYIFNKYKNLFKIDISDYNSVINKEGVISDFLKADNSTIENIVNNFTQIVELQKEKDFLDAVDELNDAIDIKDIEKIKNILLEKYQSVYQLDLEGNYSHIANKDKIFETLSLKKYENIEEVRTEFYNTVLLLGLNECTSTEEYIEKNKEELLKYIDLDNEDYIKYKTDINEKIKQAQSVEELSEKFVTEIILCCMNNVEVGARDEVGRILNTYKEYITFPEEYTKYSNKEKTYKYMIGEEYKNLEDITKQLSEAVKKAKEEDDSKNNSSSSSGGGSSGGGGFSGTYIPAVTTKPVEPQGENPVEEITDEKQDLSFEDLDNVQWAWDAIEYLSEIGIISGKEEGKFAPNDMVTREEFIKMIVGAFGIKHTKAKLAFSDIDTEAWYYNYVMWAYAEGIITGKNDTVFGIGENIKREDIAVILNRVAEYKGVELSAGENDFADSEQISAYAVDAVAKLKNEDIISGDQNKYFNPQNGATRAEAAKMIYNTVQLIKGGLSE